MRPITFWIPGRLVPKKNAIEPGVRAGKPFIRHTDRYKAYEDAATWVIRAAWGMRRAAWDRHVHVQVSYFPPDRRSLPDLSGVLETVGDLLQGPMQRRRVVGLVIGDDRQIKSWDGSRVLEPRPHCPGVRIVVRDFE